VSVTPGPHGRTVLYVEDNPDNRALVADIFAYRPRWRLLTAERAELGFDLARQHCPDLILLDVHLPDGRGDELLGRILAEPVLRDTPVVVLSADATPAQVARLRAAGAWEYLTKPIDVAQFLAVLDRFLHESAASP
jgi:CheY-like chemotaxis protein